MDNEFILEFHKKFKTNTLTSKDIQKMEHYGFKFFKKLKINEEEEKKLIDLIKKLNPTSQVAKRFESRTKSVEKKEFTTTTITQTDRLNKRLGI
jgi:hypothetical protein